MLIDSVNGEPVQEYSVNAFWKAVDRAGFPLTIRFHRDAHLDDGGYVQHVWHDGEEDEIEKILEQIPIAPNLEDPGEEGADDAAVGVIVTHTPDNELGSEIKKGMKLDAVNGVHVSHLSYTEIMEIMEEAGRPLTLRFHAEVDHKMLDAHATVRYTWDEGPLGIDLMTDCPDHSADGVEDEPWGVVLAETPGDPFPWNLEEGWKIALVDDIPCLEKS